MSGLFITMEGADGAGKSTQIEKLKDYLSNKGYDIILCREPGGTVISEAIRTVILNREFTEIFSNKWCNNFLKTHINKGIPSNISYAIW